MLLNKEAVRILYHSSPQTAHTFWHCLCHRSCP